MASILAIHTKKAIRARAHTRRRARERYGIDLTTENQKKVVRSIQEGRGFFLGRQSLRVTEWDVPFEDVKLRVIYDSEREVLVTCLPPLGEKGVIES